MLIPQLKNKLQCVWLYAIINFITADGPQAMNLVPSAIFTQASCTTRLLSLYPNLRLQPRNVENHTRKDSHCDIFSQANILYFEEEKKKWGKETNFGKNELGFRHHVHLYLMNTLSSSNWTSPENSLRLKWLLYRCHLSHIYPQVSLVLDKLSFTNFPHDIVGK